MVIVILNWNGKHLLEQFLPSVVRYSSEVELYVIDNASTDGSVLFLQEHYPQIKIVQNAENYGYAKGYNEGLKHIPAMCIAAQLRCRGLPSLARSSYAYLCS